MTSERTDDFARRDEQEAVLQELNLLLRGAEERFRERVDPPRLPMLFVVGAPRSGTTLMMQWLASSGHFAYPTNLLSRFYEAPYIGARIQQLLTDPAFDYRGELGSGQHGISWSSEVGKTRGLLEPHEFFYFWRRFFPIDQAQKLTREHLAASDPEGFAKGWGSIESVFGKPIAAKGILLQYDLAQLARWLPNAIFVHTVRDPFFNVQSLIEARERVFGTREAWFSVRPPEFEWLQHEEPFDQVAGQVHYTNRSITSELGALDAGRWLRVDYEAFCNEPSRTWASIVERLAGLGLQLELPYDGPASFDATNVLRCPPADAVKISDSCARVRAHER